MITKIDHINQVAFEIFSDLHPIEAYDLDNDRFVKYVKSKHPNVTREDIVKLIEELRGDEE